MASDLSQISAFLKTIHLFNSLDDEQISGVEHFFTILSKRQEEQICEQGDRGESFNIIYEGRVAISEKTKGGDTQHVVLVEGDFFGEEALMLKQSNSTSAQALSPTVLLCASRDQFFQLLIEFPSVKDNLSRFIQSRHFVKSHSFNWLDEDEIIYQVRRRHIAILALNLLWPALIVLFGMIVASLAGVFWMVEFVRNIIVILAAIILGIGFGWIIWAWIDWGNDYFVITNQRVVWIEMVIGLYESRNEAPMNAILSVNVRTTFLGRILNFGEVIVTTYTGKVTLDSVGNPNQLASLISEYWNRAKRNLQKADYKDMQRSVRGILGDSETLTVEANLANAPLTGSSTTSNNRSEEFQELGFWSNYFGNVFKTRFEFGNIITYRKHWYVLLRKAGIATLIILIQFFLIISFDIMYFLGRVMVPSPLFVTAIGFIFFLLILFPWWLYNYVDWRNDIYQVTDRSIFDIERRPFGTESKKSASLENILSLEHERIGFLGYILNVGNVLINVGEAKFTFNDVYEPARVQQDIFSRMQQVRFQKQKDEISRERDRILKLLEIYHQEVDQGNR